MDGRGGGSLTGDFFHFQGRDVGAATPATSLLWEKCRDVGRDAIRCDCPLTRRLHKCILFTYHNVLLQSLG